jgi:hypothetical protein
MYKIFTQLSKYMHEVEYQLTMKNAIEIFFGSEKVLRRNAC